MTLPVDPTAGSNAGMERRRARTPARPVVVRPGDEQVAVWLTEYCRLRALPNFEQKHLAACDTLKADIAAHYTGLVESIARRFIHSGEPVEDMVQEGFLGLLSALENYDPSKRVKFSTYATHFIAGAMRHCLRDRGKIIKEPAWLHELSGKVTRTEESLTQSLGRPPHAAEIAAALNLTEEAVEEIQSTRQIFHVASFQNDSDSDSTGVVDPEKIKSEKYVTLQLPIEDRIVLEGAVDKLKTLEQNVLYEFFYKDLSQTEIAKKLDISCNYVSHILKNSTKKLRRILGEAEVRDRGRNRTSSVMDSVSGLYSATHIYGRLEEEISRATRSGSSLAVVVVELTHLPENVRFREDLLALCGVEVRNNIRRVDIGGRLKVNDGEGFLLVLPHTGVQAWIVADRVSTAFKKIMQRQSEPVAARVGLAVFPADARNADGLLSAARADREADFAAPVSELAEAA